MSFVSLRASLLPRTPGFSRIAEDTLRGLSYQPLILPSWFNEREVGACIDVIAALAQEPFAISSPRTLFKDAKRSTLLLLPEALTQELPPIGGLIVVGQWAVGANPFESIFSTQVSLLRDVLLAGFAFQFEKHRLRYLIENLGVVTDSPATALVALDAAAALLAETTSSGQDLPDEVLYAAALAATVDFVLDGIDVNVAEWALVSASKTEGGALMVSDSTRVLGEDGIVEKAISLGLVSLGGPWRQPLEACAVPETFHPALTRRDIWAFETKFSRKDLSLLKARISGRSLDLPHFDFPKPLPFNGRKETIDRVIRMLSPSNKVQAVVLTGPAGVGKSSIASEICLKLSNKMVPIWLDFSEGPDVAWGAVVEKMNLKSGGDGPDDALALACQAHDILKRNAALLVVKHFSHIPPLELERWLPSGEGNCVLLMVTSSSKWFRENRERWAREYDAIQVEVPPMSIEDARLLLGSRLPDLREKISRGEADPFLPRLLYPNLVASAAPAIAKAHRQGIA